MFSTLTVIALFLLAACTPSSETPVAPPVTLEPTYQALILAQRAPDVPELPFADNPDPSQCGIPTVWGSNGRAWLTGIYDGELIQPVVLLYDSHLRFNITARAPHGTEVEILLFQENPVTDYYLVKIKDAEGAGSEGWIPEPFLSFEPVLDR